MDRGHAPGPSCINEVNHRMFQHHQSSHRRISTFLSTVRALVAAVLSVVLLSVGFAAGLVGRAHAVDSGGGLTIQPTSENVQSGITNRPTFAYKLKPGAVQNDSVTISNNKDVAQEVRVYVSTAFTADTGLIGVRASDEQIDGPAKWLTFTTKLGDGKLTIPAHKAAIIPFQIIVPPNAAPGDFAFGIAVTPVVPIPVGVPGKNTIQIVQAAASLVEMRVDGPLIPILRVASVKVSTDPKIVPGVIDGSTKVVFEVVNVGNVRLNTIIRVTELNAFGSIIHTEPDIKLNNLLPGSTVKLTRSWDNDPYVKGSVRIAISSDSDATIVRSKNFWSVSWHTFVVPVLVMLVLLALRWWIRRRRREREERRLAELAKPIVPNTSRQAEPTTTGAGRP